jgi:ABC-2 type transport system ATP-binding protein
VAIASLDLTVPEGCVYGFLGPNGAGKTTTLRLLAGLIRPSTGTATVLGYDVWRERRSIQESIGYLPGEVRLYDEATGMENLDLMACLHPMPPVRRSDLTERFELPHSLLERKVSTYSRGTLQKLGLVAAFQHDAPVYLLDEPTEGLDPLMRAVFAELLEEENRNGKTILVSSHVLTEVERTCDLVAIIRSGRLLFQGPLVDLRAQARRSLEVVFTEPTPVDWRSHPTVEEVQGTGRHHLVYFRGNPQPLLRKLVDLPVEDLSLGPGSLEDTFLSFYRGDEP